MSLFVTACYVGTWQQDLETMEPEIARAKEQQDRTKKEYNRVDAERVKLQSMASKSDYANQVCSVHLSSARLAPNREMPK